MNARRGGPTSSDVIHVQILIEKCLQLYMARKDVVQTLQKQAEIEPGFTSLVWQKLEEQNPDFFKAYYLRMKLKDQVVMFNHLVEQQLHMMQKLQANWMQTMGGGVHAGLHAPQTGNSLDMPSLLMSPPMVDPYLHPNVQLPNTNSGKSSSMGPPSGGQQDMATVLHPDDLMNSTQGHPSHHTQHTQGADHHHHSHHHSEGLHFNTPMLQSLRCLGGSTDALDALGGVEDLTLGMASFPSANDLMDLGMHSHLQLGMGELGDCELEQL